MSFWTAVRVIASRELSGYVYAPIAYIAGVLFLVLQGFSFWALVAVLSDPSQPAPLGAVLRQRAASDPVAAAMTIRRFSRLATVAVVAVTLTGGAMAWATVRVGRALTTTTYGWTLLGKIGLVAVVLVVAAYNQRRLVPVITRMAGVQSDDHNAHRKRPVPAGGSTDAPPGDDRPASASTDAPPEVPRPISGKIVELAVRNVIHGQRVENTEALANPGALEAFARLRPTLQ